MQYQFDGKKDLLYLSYLDNCIKVKVDYTNNSIFAEVSRETLQYESVIGNWIFTIPVSELLKKRDLYFMHAAAVYSQEEVVLFAGGSGSGKTTLSLGLLKHGYKIISDDEVFLFRENNKFKVVGGPEFAKISPETCSIFQDILKIPCNFTGKKMIRLDKYFPGKILRSGQVGKVIMLEKSNQYSLETIQPAEGLKRMLSVGYLNSKPDIARKNFHFLSDLATVIPVFRLKFNLDFSQLLKNLKSMK